MRVKSAKRRPGRPEFIPDDPRYAAPVGARIRAEERNRKTEFGVAKLPPSVTDAIAERKLSGGFVTSKKNISKCCFVARARNGACGSCGSKK